MPVIPCPADALPVLAQPVPYDVVDRRHGDPVSTYADTTRSRELLGWTPKHGLGEIIETAYRWHLSQLAAA